MKHAWFIRAMDDTLLVPRNVRKVLSRFDWQQPWYLGDMEDLEPPTRFPRPEHLSSGEWRLRLVRLAALSLQFVASEV